MADDQQVAWDPKILESMKPGCVTFGWDNGEIRTLEAPPHTLDDLRSAWAWINPLLKQLEAERGRPRTICFRMTDGQFRGLKFPDWNPGGA